ncbi:non-heme iron oxygenase ferredoxin subunit [bacterium]|nr:non-heme iron oxygenase ferredoxin subunit [bacterium]MBU1638419.1 non-heme iron oxygenase ferredoxin subunit [bacterium]MBU1920959.1 non-heme iron oxygenase ferredoxin subunit [bacterium]
MSSNTKWFKVCPEQELKPGRAKSVRLFGRPFAVFNLDGRLFGIDAACRHMKANLTGGKLEGSVVTCPMHGWKYDVRTGKCLTQPDSDVNTLPVKIKDNTIWIEIELPGSNSYSIA